MLKLRPFISEDSQKIVLWINDSLSFYQWSAGRFGDYPMEPAALADYYSDSEKNGGAMPFTAFDEQGIAGHFIIRFLDEEKKKARLGFIIVDSSRRGQGLGNKMLAIAIEYCKNELKAENISLGVFENNPSAIRCYEKTGFVRIPHSRYELELNGEIFGAFEMEIA